MYKLTFTTFPISNLCAKLSEVVVGYSFMLIQDQRESKLSFNSVRMHMRAFFETVGLFL